MASEPTRARLLWAILSLVPPVTFRHTTVCRSPALAFSAAIHFAMKRSAPCATVLCHLPSSWAAVVHWSALIVHWSALMPKTPRSSREYLIHSFPSPPRSPRPPPTLRTSRTSAISYPPYAPQIPRARFISCPHSSRCSHFPSCAPSFASTSVPAPAPSPSPFKSPFPPPTPTPPSTPFVPSRPSDPVTPSVRCACTGTGPCERSYWVRASATSCLQR